MVNNADICNKKESNYFFDTLSANMNDSETFCNILGGHLITSLDDKINNIVLKVK